MKQYSRFTQIGILVAAFHVIAILMLIIGHVAGKRPKIPRPIAIRTALAPRPQAVAEPQAPAKKATPSPVAAKKTLPKKEAKKIATAPLKSDTKKAQASKSAPDAERAALEKLAESLGAIASPAKASQPPSKFAVSLPMAIEIENTAKTEMRPGYGEMVSAILQNSLDLPEFGEVVAKIEITPNGTVERVEILETKSRKNGEFLKKRLQELAFPCFNEFGLTENRLNFTVTFRNVENL